MKRHPIVVPVTFFLALSLPGIQGAAAQEASSFEQLQLQVGPGDNVTVTETDGRTSSGRIIDLSPSSLDISVNGSVRQLSETDVSEIRQRRGDSLANGAITGTLAGLAAGVVSALLMALSI